MKPQVSVVVTCYNYGDFIAHCLNSLQNQTFSDFEVIIVDDGSTDDSSERILPFLKDPRFKYIKQRNKGNANAKNRGIKESNANLIAFLDADDLWNPDKLAQQITLFTRPEVGVVYSTATYIDNEGRPFPKEELGAYLQPRRGKVTEYLIHDNFVPFSSAIVRKKCFQTLGILDESFIMGNDWDLWLRFSVKYQFDYCEKPFLQYRKGHSGQLSKNTMERIRCADKIVAKFQTKYPDVLPDRIIKEATYYSYCLRAYVLRKYGFRYPLNYYSKAIYLFPLRLEAYVGLFKAPLRAILDR